MPNYKLYYITQSDFDAQIKNGKYPLQQKQLYEALAKLGTPTRGEHVVDQAKKPKDQGGEGLATKQNSAVLAAWYFSEKRRPACVTLGVPTPIAEDLEDKITRLTAELEAKAKELGDAEEAYLKQQAEIEAESESQPEAPAPVNGETAQPPAETEQPAPDAQANNKKGKNNKH